MMKKATYLKIGVFAVGGTAIGLWLWLFTLLSDFLNTLGETPLAVFLTLLSVMVFFGVAATASEGLIYWCFLRKDNNEVQK